MNINARADRTPDVGGRRSDDAGSVICFRGVLLLEAAIVCLPFINGRAEKTESALTAIPAVTLKRKNGFIHKYTGFKPQSFVHNRMAATYKFSASGSPDVTVCFVVCRCCQI